MNESEILKWCKEHNLDCKITREYSDTIKKDDYINQNVKEQTLVPEKSKIIITFSLGKKPTLEEENALIKAKSYAETMHMSKQAIYDQLVSEYGENFDKKAADYAIKNIEWDWNENALSKAKTYRDTMHMSKQGIYEHFTNG